MNSIKSPLSKEVIFTEKLKDLFTKEEVDGCFVFYIPKDEGDVVIFDMGLCGHVLLKLSDSLREVGEKRLTEDGEHKE